MTPITPSQAVFLLNDECTVQGTVRHDDDGIRIVLKHDYADAKIARGWTVKGRGVDGTVAKIEGRVMTVEE